MANYSPFTITASAASELVKRRDDNRCCYLIQISFRAIYGGSVPNSAHKKIPRLINGIPLGAGRLTQSQASDIIWRLVEGPVDMCTFLSVPIGYQEAHESRQTLKERLVRQAKQVFGEVTVKCNIMLSQCLQFDADLYVNDIAEPHEEGLQFLD